MLFINNRNHRLKLLILFLIMPFVAKAWANTPALNSTVPAQIINPLIFEYPQFLPPSANTANNLLAAERAYTQKNFKELDNLLNNETHNLAQDVIRYWRYLLKPENYNGENELSQTLTPTIKNNLRRKWLNNEAKNNNYQVALDNYLLLEGANWEEKCNWALANFYAGKNAPNYTQAQEIMQSSWSENFKPINACKDLNQKFVRNFALDEKKYYYRLRQILGLKQKSEFLAISENIKLPATFTPSDFFLKSEQLINKFNKYNSSKTSVNALSQSEQNLLIFTTTAIANTDIDSANDFFWQNQDLFTPNSQNITCSILLWRLAENFNTNTHKFANCGGQIINEVLEDSQIESVIRFFIRAQNWQVVSALINKLPPKLKDNDTAWVYWQTYANLAQKKIQLTAKLVSSTLSAPSSNSPDHQYILNEINRVERIRERPDMYGALVNELFGYSPHIPVFAPAITKEEFNQIASNPCFQWSSYLINLGGQLRNLGTVEWSYCTRKLESDRQKLAASQFALSKNIYDRAINTAILTKDEHDWRTRFLTPYFSEVSKSANEKGLAPEFIYGLIRQESRFVIDARSVSGARGLMQIMPATGKWLAGKLAVKPFSTDMLNDIPTNIHFGTSYLAMLFEKFNHPVLVTASYNAGPSRADKWMRGENLVDAIIYTESIPFTETRNYVKAVLWNATIYQILNGKKDAKISSWLQPINFQKAAGYLP